MLSFKSPENYNELLPKLNVFTFFTTLIFFLLLRYFKLIPNIEIDKTLIPPIEKSKAIIEWLLSFGVIPIGAAFLALFFSSSFEMHNKISKKLKIRYFWEKKFIIQPLIARSGYKIHLTKDNIKKIMNDFYYQEVKKIDQHYVKLFWRYALPFWVLFEHTIIVFVVSVIMTIIKINFAVLYLWIYFIILLILTALQLIFVTAQKSTDQVNQIPKREIAKYFKANFI
jgi:hypothetical protein